MTIQDLYDQLESHDWYYNYSDDINEYKAGRTSRQAIVDLADSLGEEGIDLEKAYATYVFTRMCPNPSPKPPRPL